MTEVNFEDIESLDEETKEKLNNYTKGLVSKDWRQFVSEENGTHASTASMQSLDDLAKSFIHGQQLIGKKGLLQPTEDSSEEDWNEYWTKLGRPGKPEEYEFEPVEGLEDVDFKEIEDAFRKEAHKSGMSKAQANTSWKFFKETTKNGKDELNTNYKTKYNTEWSALKNEWGNAYPEKIKKTQALLAKFGDENINKWIKSSGITKEATAVKFLSKIADSFSEDKLESGSHIVGAHTPSEALSKAKSLMVKDGPYFDKKDARHESVVKEVEALFLEAYPTGK